MRKKRKAVKRRSRSKLHSFLRGKMSLGVLAIMALVIIGSMFIIGGVLPNSSTFKPFSDTPVQLDFSNIGPGGVAGGGGSGGGGGGTGGGGTGNNTSGENLQLKTVPYKQCGETLAVDFLVDVSGSMKGAKIEQTREALKKFMDIIPDNGVVGIQKFSDGASNVQNLVLFKDVKDTIKSTIDSSIRDDGGFTWTRTGFNQAKNALDDAKNQNKFPGYSYALIFLSDGIPEVTGESECLVKVGTRCFSKTQDPRDPPGPDIPQQIKNSGIKIFSIGIYNASDASLQSYLETLLKDVASDPDDKYYYPTFDPNKLTEIFNLISTRVCG